jgi:hypothetical protein
VDRQDVGVLQLGRGLDLAVEALSAEQRCDGRVEHLERDPTFVPQVGGEIDGGHAASPELALEGVAVAEGVGERGRDVGHGCSPSYRDGVPGARRSLSECHHYAIGAHVLP